jgi:hypothetical protein
MRRATGAFLVTAQVASLSMLVAAPASAAPPVAVDDQVTIYDGGIEYVDVLANDSDPDGDDLTICRIGEVSDPAPSIVGIDEGYLVVGLFGEVPGVVTITYYACDLETMVPATLTLTVKPVDSPRLTKTDRPGVLRVTNPNDHATRFSWGVENRGRFEHVDGRVAIPAHDSVFVRVHHHRIYWEAFYRHYRVIWSGSIGRIRLPGDDRGQPAG